MDSAVSPVFVQFPHPGPEHNPGKVHRQAWNRHKHRRKFLRSDGRYVDRNDSINDAPLVFWGEWEAPSHLIKRWPKNGSLPRFLHDPVWEHPVDADFRQNTDPWVFGDCFRYSNCHQLNQNLLRTLPPGSVVLFGSASRREATFVIDTVFVVGKALPFSPNKPPDTDEAFRVCTVESLKTGGNAEDLFTLYEGATHKNQINFMYSFVPCRRADSENRRFSRPPISLPACYVNPSSTQSPSNARIPRSESEVREQWERVREQVIDTGCLLGVSFSTPRLDNERRSG
jgi:hypothetical protein